MFPSHWMKNHKNQALLIMVITLALLIVTEPQIGLTWDEPDYIVASETYSAWFGELSCSRLVTPIGVAR